MKERNVRMKIVIKETNEQYLDVVRVTETHLRENYERIDENLTLMDKERSKWGKQSTGKG